MKRVLADLKYYNANPANRSTDDCVKRALSFAFSMNYDDVTRELHKIAKEIGSSRWNTTLVVDEFLNRRGLHLSRTSEGLTVSEFSESHPGIWVLLTGSKSQSVKGFSTHMVCVMDGDIYDSWDSSDEYVVQVCNIPNGKKGLIDITYDDVEDEVGDYIENYLTYLQKKCPDGMKLSFDQFDKEDGRVNRYTHEYRIICEFGHVKIPYGSKYWGSRYADFYLISKVNPRLSIEDNIDQLNKRCKQRIYDWVYAIRKDILDAEKSEEVEFNPHYKGSKKDLMRFPDWSIPLIREFNDFGSNLNRDRYELYMDPLEDDPRKDSIGTVWLRAETLRELKQDLEYYRKTYSRVDYDY